MSIEKRIEELGLHLPVPPKPVAQYVPGIRTGNLVFTAGQIPIKDGVLQYKGKVGCDCTLEDGYQAARICLMNCLGVIKSLVGNLDRVKQVVKITGFVNCISEFTDHPGVINGASELCVQIFGDKGRHARSALGANGLPLNALVELEMIVEVE